MTLKCYKGGGGDAMNLKFYIQNKSPSKMKAKENKTRSRTVLLP